MVLKHILGEFRTNGDKAELVSLANSDDYLKVNAELLKNNDDPFNAKLLHEMRWPQYRQVLIDANMAVVKEKIAQSVNIDTHIIQSINSVEELDKICNTLVKRIREWYGYYYPEFSHDTSDNELFIKKILEKSKDELMIEHNQKISMGPSIDQKDLDALMSFARQVDDMFIERQRLMNYIDNTLMYYTPNMYTLVGGMISAKLIEKAGSLKHLAMMPSSTVQLLGAEKALFRHLRNRKIRPPKHGLILSHPLVMNAKRTNKGAAARMLAAKISISCRVDYFKGEFIADQLLLDLRKQLEDNSKLSY